MTRPRSHAVIGAAVFAVLCAALPVTWTIASPDAATSLGYIAALAIAAAIAMAANVTTLPVPGLTRLSLNRDREPDELTWQSDPSAAGHIRPRAPGPPLT